MENQIPTKSSGQSQRTNEDNMSKLEILEQENNSLRYHLSLTDQTAFRDMILKQIAMTNQKLDMMTQNLLNIQEAIEKASSEESEDFYEEPKREQNHAYHKEKNYDKIEYEDESKEDTEDIFDDDEEKPKQKKGRPIGS